MYIYSNMAVTCGDTEPNISYCITLRYIIAQQQNHKELYKQIAHIPYGRNLLHGANLACISIEMDVPSTELSTACRPSLAQLCTAVITGTIF